LGAIAFLEHPHHLINMLNSSSKILQRRSATLALIKMFCATKDATCSQSPKNTTHNLAKRARERDANQIGARNSMRHSRDAAVL
jgi:hypothetical protein